MPEASSPAVAHAMQCYLGLSETFIYAILRNLRTFKPVVVADTRENLDLFPFEPVYATDTIQRFSWWWLVNGLYYRFGRKADFFEQIVYVRHVMKKHGVQLIHAHFGPVGVKMLPVKRALGIPLVTTFYGYDMSRLPKQAKWRETYTRLFDEGDHFLIEGGHMRDRLIDIGCPPEKVSVQHIGVDLSRLVFRERMRAPDEKTILLFCGRFTEKKGLIYALQALARVAPSHPDLEFRIIGDGEDRPAVERVIAEHKLDAYVRLLGAQPYRVFLEQLNEAHLFIQPSVTAADGDTEGGAPTVLIEAQACGIPVLATTHADIPEVVCDGESGFLAPERDPEALADRLQYLLARPDDWPVMGQIGRRHIEAEYDIAQLAAQLERAYETVVA